MDFEDAVKTTGVAIAYIADCMMALGKRDSEVALVNVCCLLSNQDPVFLQFDLTNPIFDEVEWMPISEDGDENFELLQ